MLDLETLSVRPHAVILVIGAIKFERTDTWQDDVDEKKIKKFDTFYRRITISSCVSLGMDIDPLTSKWWQKQEKDIKYEAIVNKDRIELKQALEEFSTWFGNSTFIYGNGSSFDVTILSEAYSRCGMKIPWKYWFIRDLRTVMDIGGIKMSDVPQYNKHNALYDCYRQILAVQRSIKSLKQI